MWQDGLALLIVVIAALALLRSWLPSGLFRFGHRQGDDGSVKNAPPTGGCGGCASGSSCAKVQIKVYPIAVGRGKRLPSDPC
ncbi:MAG: hypothetical protein RKP20_06370 [Candidatus Competibacter sp.]|mgnify:CR=1 FL=1|nr:hypothetical protein [Candidatus Competibacter sp.]